MHLEKIFELIRKEDTVLWIGSGFSLYAGYPNGKQLSEIIYQSLSTFEKENIAPNLPLMELAEQFVRIKAGSRNNLIALVRKELSKKPTSTKWHKILANIPHIKTIITTNYDRLFELAYKDEIQTIIHQTDVAYRDQKTELFKVHGDINHPDTMIITKSDYADFFRKNNQENLIWTSIKERISNKAVVFIGYDLEDDNISNILKEIYEALGANRKEIFLIAPAFKQYKILHLSQLGIQYLDFKGEVFVEKLYANIKDRITTDFSSGFISADTLRKFFRKNNLLVDLKSSEDQYRITSINTHSENISAKMSLKFKNDKAFSEPFDAFMNGRKFGQICINGSDLEKMKFLLNDVNIIDDNVSDFKLVLKSLPFKQGKVSVVFEDGAEFENIQYEVFQSKQLTEIVANFKKCEFNYKFSFNEDSFKKESITATFTFKQSEKFQNVNDAIAVSNLCLRISNGLGFTIYSEDDNKGVYLKPKNPELSLENHESHIDFFENLKKVEKLYNLRFTNFYNYSKEDFDNVYKVIQFAKGNFYEQDWDEELSWNLESGVSLDLLLKIQEGAHLQVESQDFEEVNILNQSIKLGYQVAQPLDLYITNLEEVMEKQSTLVKVRSRSKKIRIHYSVSKRGEESFIAAQS